MLVLSLHSGWEQLVATNSATQQAQQVVEPSCCSLIWVFTLRKVLQGLHDSEQNSTSTLRQLQRQPTGLVRHTGLPGALSWT